MAHGLSPWGKLAGTTDYVLTVKTGMQHIVELDLHIEFDGNWLLDGQWARNARLLHDALQHKCIAKLLLQCGRCVWVYSSDPESGMPMMSCHSGPKVLGLKHSDCIHLEDPSVAQTLMNSFVLYANGEEIRGWTEYTLCNIFSDTDEDE